eukprot:CAMPEP_0182546800 /NCGR_PEP_ID=MMETSP1323-20130603/36561_1 /TAXON_ID=236787 /ORGANISM="Florenciella parvula, Strain RCC1693" /LENGTH=52 /DNA_ID=CAMNT_0024758061 /DNA_START=75 /DNA_END=233 /DNA_ORIENTATION=-
MEDLCLCIFQNLTTPQVGPLTAANWRDPALGSCLKIQPQVPPSAYESSSLVP